MTGKDDDVGPKRPPKRTRFKPGVSGNPRGRPKGSKNISTIIDTLMGDRIYITENGRRRPVSAREAIVLSLRNDALRGDAKARTAIVTLDLQVEARRAGAEPENAKGSEADAAVMGRIVDRVRRDLERGRK